MATDDKSARKGKPRTRRIIQLPKPPGRIRRIDRDTRYWQERRYNGGECPVHGTRLQELGISYRDSGAADYVTRGKCGDPTCTLTSIYDAREGVPHAVLDDPRPKTPAIRVLDPYHPKGTRRMRRRKLSMVLFRRINSAIREGREERACRDVARLLRWCGDYEQEILGRIESTLRHYGRFTALARRALGPSRLTPHLNRYGAVHWS